MSEKKCDFVIVYGALRSGTTLLRLMLNKHSELTCQGESDYIFDFLSFGDDGVAEFDLQALERNRIYQNSGTVFPVGKTPKQAILDVIVQLQQQPNQRVVLMLHRGIEKALELFPNVRILHILRDPRDVARSSIGMGWAGNVYHGVEHWIKTEQEWDRVVLNTSDGQIETLHYEKLIQNTSKELNRICEFFGVAFEEEMISYHVSTTYSEPDPTLIEQWKRKQSPREVALVEGQLGGMLTARDYLPSGHHPCKPGQAEKLALLVYSKWVVWRERVRRYGLFDPVLVAISQRLRIPSAGYKAQARIDKIQRTYRK